MAVAAVVLAGSAIAYAAYPSDSVTVMTGCLGHDGNLHHIATDPTTPSHACGKNMQLVHISGGTITQVSAGDGVTVSGSGGAGYVDNGFATVGIDPKYQLPQTNCANGQFVTPDGSGGWTCQTATTYSGADFATSNQSCEAGKFVTGIDATGAITCATPPKPTLAELNGSPCTAGNEISTIAVTTDPTTGSVSLTCQVAYTQSASDCTSTGSTFTVVTPPIAGSGSTLWTCTPGVNSTAAEWDTLVEDCVHDSTVLNSNSGFALTFTGTEDSCKTF